MLYQKMIVIAKNTTFCLEVYGGDNNENNLVNLTAEEHFIAHYLLYRICKDTPNSKKMSSALWMMCRTNNTQQRLITTEQYAIGKRIFNEINVGNKNAEGKHWFTNGIKQVFCKECPEGWHRGRLPVSEETRNKLSISNKCRNTITTLGMHWWTNDIDEMMCKECPEGWHRGRLTASEDTRNKISVAKRGQNPLANMSKEAIDERNRKISVSKKGDRNPSFGKHWFNNGIINVYMKECTKGFVKGMLILNQEAL